MKSEPPRISEARLLWVIGAVQFVNVLDFMMVMPLGPDLATGLGIPTSEIGLIGGSYTAAAAVSGIAGSTFLDRFDRRKALAAALFGLVIGTLLGGFATGLTTLMGARILAGACGGPATSLSLAIIADAVEPARRGRAMGAVMGAFSVASVFGVPAGLELARLGGWRMPFFAVAFLSAIVAVLSVALMPSFTSHLHKAEPKAHVGALLKRREAQFSLLAVACAMVANFSLIPNLATYWQFNRGYPRDKLGLLYLVGGAVTFLTLRLSGKLTDHFGPTRVASAGTLMYVTILFLGFVRPLVDLPVMVIFVSFMVTGTFRMIPMQALTSRVPRGAERAGFMSFLSAVQHFASATGAALSTRILVERPGGALEGMDRLAGFAIGLALLLPVLLGLVERRVRAREAENTVLSAVETPARG